MKDYVQAEKEMKEKPLRGPVEPIAQSCSSSEIDKILNSPDLQLKVSYKVPECGAVKFVSNPTGGMEAPRDDFIVSIHCIYLVQLIEHPILRIPNILIVYFENFFQIKS